MSVMDMLAEIFEEVSPDFSPDSPTVSPKQKPHQAEVLAPLAPLARRSGEPNSGHPFPCQGCPALEVIDVAGASLAGCVKSLPPASPWREEWRPIPAGMTRCPEKPREARGYGCGFCGTAIYTEAPGGWRCQGCGTLYAIIGGSKGPRLIH